MLIWGSKGQRSRSQDCLQICFRICIITVQQSESIFANWATGHGFDPLRPTAAQKSTFLYELFDTHILSHLTIKGYRSCLASVLSRTGMAAAVQAKTISDMIMSMDYVRGLD